MDPITYLFTYLLLISILLSEKILSMLLLGIKIRKILTF